MLILATFTLVIAARKEIARNARTSKTSENNENGKNGKNSKNEKKGKNLGINLA